MKKILALILVAVMAISLVACGGTKPAETTAAQSGNTPKVGDAGKIAVLRNLNASDHTTQFFAGIEAEGKALGYQVDTYISDGDDAKMQDLMDQAFSKKYDIWIVSHANEGYQYNYVSKAVEAGIKVVCFDCQGEHVEGVTYTDQSDLVMAERCVEQLIEKCKGVDPDAPVTVGEYIVLGAIVPFDLRGAKFQEYADAGKIDLNIMAMSRDDAYSSAYTQATALMSNVKTPIGLFCASTISDVINGFNDAIKDAGREGTVFVNGVDISNDVIELLQKVPTFVGAACCDPYVVGVVCTRLAVMKVLGEETPEIYHCVPALVTGDDLEAEDNMSNLGNKIEGFTTTDEFKTEGIEAQRAKFAN